MTKNSPDYANAKIRTENTLANADSGFEPNIEFQAHAAIPIRLISQTKKEPISYISVRYQLQ